MTTSFSDMAFELRLATHNAASSAADVEDLVIQLELGIEDDTNEPAKISGCRAALADLHRRAEVFARATELLTRLAPFEQQILDQLKSSRARNEERAFLDRIKDDLLDFVRRKGRRRPDMWPSFCWIRGQLGGGE